ncbi:AAA family ATPase [Deinococcus lacus]|uniref:AAA family ATPase n=1 Tax=Deinococcus lacus TaxID=392561 RepID=A0ABW1YCU4_9DEIO
MLLILAGIPGTGKSALARELSRRLGAAYLRVDKVEAALLNAGQQRVTVEGYAAAYALAADNLSLGLSVVADCVNPVPETREAWAGVARQAGARLVNVEVICSDAAEHRRRVEARHADAEAHAGRWSPPDWEAVRGWDYQPWHSEVWRVDTAREATETLASQVLLRLKTS